MRLTCSPIRPLRYLVPCTAIALPLLSARTWAETLTPGATIATVRAHGANQAVATIWASPGQTRRLLPGVSAAAPDWLKAARLLRPGADADAAEDLDDAFAQALPKAPYRLLPTLKTACWRGTGTACLFGWSSELPGGAEHYVGTLRGALRAPAPKGLEPLRWECLRGLWQTLVDLKRAGK